MCGITGIIHKKKSAGNMRLIIHSMSNALKHRGPDDEGFLLVNENSVSAAGSDDTQQSCWNSSLSYTPKKSINDCNENYHFAFGHRRLAVIDLSEAAHQPMCDDSENIWIVCNGEIYNYIELRKELQAAGFTFTSKSDIEVLLAAYKHWGVECLSKFNGMWSFVIYDKKKQLLFGSRDRLGVKPFYYYNDSKTFAFASEQKALLQIQVVETGINYPAVFEHLLMAQIELQSEGFFKNIFELSPGHYFMYDLKTNELKIEKYYTLAFEYSTSHFSKSKLKDYSEQLVNKMTHAVNVRLRSDVPVGFCLSGGLDSSTIVSIASKINNKNKLSQLSDNITVFTATNTNENTDESKWAAIIAKKNNIRWVKAECNPENIMSELEDIIYHQDIPLCTTSTYAQNKVMQSAKENGVTILLDGQGGDELFAGYPVFYTSYYLELLKRFRFGNFINELAHTGNAPYSAGVFFKSTGKIIMDSILPDFITPMIAGSIKKELHFFSSNFRKKNNQLINFSNDFNAKPLNASLHNYCTDYYLRNLLRWEDRCSMQYSIESRTPFADDVALINFIFQIPSVYKIKHGWSKYLMRVAIKGLVPEEIRLRKDKLGFSTPQQQWLKVIHPQMKTIVQDFGRSSEIINNELLLTKWDSIFNDDRQLKIQAFIWRYVCFLIWKKKFF